MSSNIPLDGMRAIARSAICGARINALIYCALFNVTKDL